MKSVIIISALLTVFVLCAQAAPQNGKNSTSPSSPKDVKTQAPPAKPKRDTKATLAATTPKPKSPNSNSQPPKAPSSIPAASANKGPTSKPAHALRVVRSANITTLPADVGEHKGAKSEPIDNVKTPTSGASAAVHVTKISSAESGEKSSEEKEPTARPFFSSIAHLFSSDKSENKPEPKKGAGNDSAVTTTGSHPAANSKPTPVFD